MRVLARARKHRADPAWAADYRATRPKVERKLAHLMRRKARRAPSTNARQAKAAADFQLLAAAANLARRAVLGVHSTITVWAVA